MEQIKEIFQNIEKCMCLYYSGEITFDQAYDEAQPYFGELFYIRNKEIIDNLVDVKSVVDKEEINGSFKN